MSNIIVKDENHWDIFDEDYKKLVSNKDNFKYFRRNGMSNMLETGLPSQDRKELIASNGKEMYPEKYNENECTDICLRRNELFTYFGKRNVLNNLEPQTGIGSPRHYTHPNIGIRFGYGYHNKLKFNFDDLYHVYGYCQIQSILNKLGIDRMKMVELERIGIGPNKEENVKEIASYNILEIGGGYGNLAYKIIKNFRNVKYIIVDLPEVLDIQEYYLENAFKYYNEIFPKQKKYFKIIKVSEKDNISNLENLNYDVLLVPFNKYKELSLTFNLAINMRSLGEMPKDVMNDYINWIQNNIQMDGLFYLVNRYVFTKSVDGNKLRDYNFDDNWEVLISQPQWLQSHLHEFMLRRNNKPSLPFRFILSTFPLRTPPPGPIMNKIETQEQWLKNQKILPK